MSTRSAAVKKRVEADASGIDAGVISLASAELGWVFRLKKPKGGFSDKEFWRFCRYNPDLRIEMTKEGEMIIMMPMVPMGGNRKFKLSGRFSAWVDADNTGQGFSPSTIFTLPNGAKRSPDVSWIRRERWDAMTDEQKNSTTAVCPDFVVELRSKIDRLKPLQKKMAEYSESGAQLGWLIDPKKKRVYVYRPGAPVEVLDNPTEVSGEPLLKGFTLKLAGIID
ncbi:MAG: Uma2 family endonuclease [Acidobacteriota bacterium]|nr:Uma2 family endonuclease [Acidobacteriota bacterium]